MNVCGTRYGEHFVHDIFDDLPRVSAGGDLPVLRSAQSGDRIQRTVPHQFGPQLAFEVVGDAAGNACTLEERCEPFGAFVAWPNNKIAATNMLYGAGLWHGS